MQIIASHHDHVIKMNLDIHENTTILCLNRIQHQLFNVSIPTLNLRTIFLAYL